MATKKPSVTTKEQWIVTWDNDEGDPVRVFDTEEKARKFILSDLITDNPNGIVDSSEVVKDSIKLYRGTLVGKAKVTVTFE